MLLTAHRVRSAQGLTGINVYVYRHPAGAWDPSALDAMERAAELAGQVFEVPPGGNRLTSYLDVFAAEGTHAADIARAAAAVRSGPDPTAFPAEFAKGGVIFRLGLAFGLVPSWRNEFTDLVSRLMLSAEDTGTSAS
jgi:hypothetical protein